MNSGQWQLMSEYLGSIRHSGRDNCAHYEPAGMVHGERDKKIDHWPGNQAAPGSATAAVTGESKQRATVKNHEQPFWPCLSCPHTDHIITTPNVNYSSRVKTKNKNRKQKKTQAHPNESHMPSKKHVIIFLDIDTRSRAYTVFPRPVP